MRLNAEDFLYQKADAKTFIFAGLAVIGALIGIFFVYKLIKFCYSIERYSGKSAHTLIKTIMIAAAPSVYTVLSLLKIEIETPFSIFIAISIVMFFIVLVWNIRTYRIFSGILFSIVHGIFGSLACLGVGMLVFVGIFLVASLFFSGDSSSGNSSEAPSTIIDDVNGIPYHVHKGFNGELYVEDNGRTGILRKGDYPGRYFDDMGNHYHT